MSAKSKFKKQSSVVLPLSTDPNALSFSLKQAANITGIALWAIRSAIWGRRLQAHLVGKKQIVLHDDLQQWLASSPLVHGGKK